MDQKKKVFWGWLIVGNDLKKCVADGLAAYQKRYGQPPKAAQVLDSALGLSAILQAAGLEVETMTGGMLPRDVYFQVETGEQC